MAYNPTGSVASNVIAWSLALDQLDVAQDAVDEANAALEARVDALEATQNPTPLTPAFTSQPTITTDGSPQVGEIITGNDATVANLGTNRLRRTWLKGATIVGTDAAITTAEVGNYTFRNEIVSTAGDVLATVSVSCFVEAVWTPTSPVNNMRQIGFNSPADAGQDTPSFLFLNRMKSCASNGVWNNDATLSAYAYPQSAGTNQRDTATFVGLRRPTTGTIRYVLRHNGAGLVWHWSAQNLTIVDASNPNRVIFDVGPAIGDQPQLVLSSATTWPDYRPGDPMETRDGFAVYELSQEADYLAGKQFMPEAIAAQSKYWCHRAMDAFKTNNSLVRTIADRTPVGNCSYSNGTAWGPPLQVIIDLINECNIPVFWYNPPYRASEEYVRWMIQTIKDGLRPSCKAMQETGNEPWNFGAGFDQSFAFYEQRGQQLSPSRGNPQGYGYCATLNMIIAREIWADDPDRLICTLNLQADSNSNYEGVAEGVAIAGKHIGKDFDTVSVAMYTSGGAQDLANPDYAGGSDAKRQLLLDEIDRYEATGADFASRSVRQELIDQLRHGNVIPGWPNAITLDGVLRQCTDLKAFCRKYGIRHATIYEMQDPHTNLETLGPVNGKRGNVMFTAFQNDIRVSGIQEGSYERDRFRYMRSQGVSGYAVLTDVGPLSEYGAWRTKTDFYTPDTRLWDFYEWYNENGNDPLLFEMNLLGDDPATNVGRTFKLRVVSYGGLCPTKTRFPLLTAGTLPPGITYEQGELHGVPTTVGDYPLTFEIRDAGDNPVSISFTVSVAAQEAGYRFHQLEIFATNQGGKLVDGQGGLPSLSEWYPRKNGVRMDTTGWTFTGTQFSTGEGVQNLTDGNINTVWTGRSGVVNVIIADAGEGNRALPDEWVMEDRHDFQSRTPGDFRNSVRNVAGEAGFETFRTIKYNDTVPGNQFCIENVQDFNYPDHVFIAPMTYRG